MKKYLAVFLGSLEKTQKWEGVAEAEQKERQKLGMEAWGAWAETYKDKIVDMGSPLGKTKKIDKEGVSDIKNEMAAFTIIEAESYDEAAKMFLDHPHFSIFPGDRVEVMEMLPMPSMK